MHSIWYANTLDGTDGTDADAIMNAHACTQACIWAQSAGSVRCLIIYSISPIKIKSKTNQPIGRTAAHETDEIGSATHTHTSHTSRTHRCFGSENKTAGARVFTARSI